MKAKVMQIITKKQKAQIMWRTRLNEKRLSEDESLLQSGTPVCQTYDSPSSSSTAANDGQPKRSSKQKGKTTPKMTKSTAKRP